MLTICKIALCASFLLTSNIVWAQSSDITIDDFAWIAGHWTGEGFGGEMEEYWAPPSDDVMMGMFKHSKDGKITFYEFFTIVKNNDQWDLKLKHFDPDFAGWEEKTDYVTFPLVSASPTKIAFDGLVMKKVSGDQMEVLLTMKRNGEVSVERFIYNRVGKLTIYE